MKLSETQRPPRWLIQGDSGSGKTHLIGTLCQLVPTLVVTSDLSGLDTLAQMGLDPDVIHVAEWPKVWDYYEQIKSGASRYVALAVDDLGAMQSRTRTKIQMEPVGRDEERMPSERRKAAIEQALMRGERRMILPQFGSLDTAMSAFIDSVLAVPYKLQMWTCLHEPHEHPRTGARHLFPAMLGNIRYELPALFSLVGTTFIAYPDGKALHCLTCRPHPRIETKSRYGPGRTWVDPTAERLMAHTAGKEAQETEQEQRIGSGIPESKEGR